MHSNSDLLLLQRWRDERDAPAFQTLAQRYSGVVYGVCHRILKNSADAEEVAQDCFLKLAHHPAAPGQSVGPWLHSVAVRASLDRIRGEKRRRAREHVFADRFNEEAPESAHTLLAHVDEAIEELPATLRECVVRHFLEQKTQEEVAAVLGISTRTVRRRTQEAIEQLRETLRERGITAGAGVLAATLGGLGATASPPGLQVALGKLALGSKAQGNGVALPVAAGKATLKMGGVLVMKKVAGLIVLLGVAAVVAWRLSGEDNEAYAPASPLATQAEVVVDSPESLPAAEATAPPAAAADEPQLNAPEKTPDLALWSRVEDVAAFAPEPIANPTKYAEIAGLVVDEEDNAIPEAEIRVLFYGSKNLPLQEPSEVTRFAAWDLYSKLWEDERFRRKTTTDGAGTFHIDAISFSGYAQLHISAPGFAPRSSQQTIASEQVTQVTYTLKAAQAVHGEVVTPEGRPVAGALVDAEGQVGEFAESMEGPTPEVWRTRTDERGYFSLWLPEIRLGGLSYDGDLFTAVHVKSAEHGEALLFPVAVGGEERVRLTLAPEIGTLAGQILQREGIPAVGYHVFLQGRADLHMTNKTSVYVGQGYGYEAITDDEGRYRLDGIATFLDYTATLYAPNREVSATRRLPKIAPGETTTWNHTIDAPIQFRCLVYGEGTRTPIPGVEVFWMPAEPGPDGRTAGTSMKTGEDGAISATITTGEGAYRFIPVMEAFLISREGEDKPVYEQTVALHSGEEVLIELEVPNPWRRPFHIVDPAGNPLEGVRASMHRQAGDSNTTSRRREQTDETGYVEFGPLPPETPVRFKFEKAGFLFAESGEALGAAGETLPVETLILYPHADLAARLLDTEGAPLRDTKLTCSVMYDGREKNVEAVTDAEGWLVVREALPGTALDLRLDVPESADRSALTARLDDLKLTAGMENGLGEIRMAPAN